MRTRAHYAERASPAQQAMARAEGRIDEAMHRMIEARRKLIDAYQTWAADGADLALLGDFGRSTRDMMAQVYTEARERRRGV